MVGATLALAAAPSSASAAIIVGDSTFNPVEECTPAGATFVQTNSAAHPYVAPTDGVITSWAHRAGANPPALRFRVLRQRAGTSFFTLVGESASTAQIEFALNEFPIRLPVRSGDAIGLLIGASATPYHCASRRIEGVAGETEARFQTPNTVGSETLFEGPYFGYRLDISAQLEPDDDGDGFGDETQDQCPTSALTQGPCPMRRSPENDPPQTTITNRPPNKTEKSAVTFKFRSNEKGSVFECKLDKKQFKPCSSPKKVKHLAEAKHRFKVRAKDSAGNLDPSPAVDKFEVIG